MVMVMVIVMVIQEQKEEEEEDLSTPDENLLLTDNATYGKLQFYFVLLSWPRIFLSVHSLLYHVSICILAYASSNPAYCMCTVYAFIHGIYFIIYTIR